MCGDDIEPLRSDVESDPWEQLLELATFGCWSDSGMQGDDIERNSDATHISKEEAMYELQTDGFTIVPGGLPKWAVFDYVEHMHSLYHTKIKDLLESLKDEWHLGDDRSSRMGTKVSWLATERIAKEGIEGVSIVATHPSVDQDSWECNGPRFYVSLVEAALHSFGETCDGDLISCLPPPPDSLAELLWPDKEDWSRPRVTELGWTIVPPGSDPQQLHADISSGEDVDPVPRKRGRFQHIIWKPDRNLSCTTQILPKGFTDGDIDDVDYDELEQVRGNCILLDSEVLHRGNWTTLKGGWSSSCTVQFCSSTGWDALKDRISYKSSKYTCALQHAEKVCLPSWESDTTYSDSDDELSQFWDTDVDSFDLPENPSLKGDIVGESSVSKRQLARPTECTSSLPPWKRQRG